MKRFTVLTLIAGLMVTGCTLGMELGPKFNKIHDEFIQICNACTLSTNFRKTVQNQLKKHNNNTNTEQKFLNKLNVLREALNDKGFNKTRAADMKKSLIAGIDTLCQSITAETTPTGTTPTTDPASNKGRFIDLDAKTYAPQTSPNPVPTPAPATSTLSTSTPPKIDYEADHTDRLGARILSKFDSAETIKQYRAAEELKKATSLEAKLNILQNMLDNKAFMGNKAELQKEIDDFRAELKKLAGDATEPITKPLPTKSLLRNPLFIGTVVLSSLAAVTYIYWQKQKTKKPDTTDDELDEEIMYV